MSQDAYQAWGRVSRGWRWPFVMSVEAVVSSLVSEGERGIPGQDPGGFEVARARYLVWVCLSRFFLRSAGYRRMTCSIKV